MKTSFTAFAVLAAVALSAPAFAQGNAFFDYQQLQPSRAEQEQIARQERRDTDRAYALTGKSERRAEERVGQHSGYAPGNGFMPVELPSNR